MLGVVVVTTSDVDINCHVGVDIEKAVIVITTPDVDINSHVGIDTDKAVIVVTTPNVDANFRLGLNIEEAAVVRYGCWGSEGGDTKGEEGKSGESEGTHCRWVMSVGKRVTG